ncbi:hypothetical protein B296_00008326 [Ensete ventricosum]|uniref:Uncharacterized protein n=1 Tax=Ensete ventricosum TaxID=4639 RepID=A0A426ZUA7_ENSVE|nr:hypothetical protein B296_00008326 [Ensete ventricosum]
MGRSISACHVITKLGGPFIWQHLQRHFDTVRRTDKAADKTGVRVARSQHLNLRRTSLRPVDPGSPRAPPPQIPAVLTGNVESAGMKSLRALAVMGVGVYGVISFATVASADEAEHGIACPSYPWPHKGILDSYDHDHAS